MVPIFAFFHLENLLHLVPQNIVNDRRDASLDAGIAVYVNSTVSLVTAQNLEAAFVPFAAGLRFYPSAVQIAGNVHKHFARSNTSVNLPDDCCCGFINNNLAIFATLVAQRLPAIRHALAGVVHQATAHIFGQVVRVELVDVHHTAQGKTPSGRIVKILLGVEHLYTAIHQAGFIDHGLHHVSTHAVGLPRQDILKLSALGISHHPLKRRTVVGAAADRAVFVGVGDGQPKFCSVFPAGLNLLFDGNIPLVMGRVAGIDDGVAPGGLLLFCHYPTPPTSKR